MLEKRVVAVAVAAAAVAVVTLAVQVTNCDCWNKIWRPHIENFSGFGTVRSGQTFQENILHSWCSESFVAAYQTSRCGKPEHRNIWQWPYCRGKRGIMRHIFKTQLYGFVTSTWMLSMKICALGAVCCLSQTLGCELCCNCWGILNLQKFVFVCVCVCVCVCGVWVCVCVCVCMCVFDSQRSQFMLDILIKFQQNWLR